MAEAPPLRNVVSTATASTTGSIGWMWLKYAFSSASQTGSLGIEKTPLERTYATSWGSIWCVPAIYGKP